MPTNASGPNDSDGGDPLSRTVGIDHLTLLQVSPPELVTIASETGFDAIGIRVVTAGPGEEPWPLTVGSPMLEETLRRLQDTGVQVLDVEVIRLGPEIKRQDYEAVLEVGGRLGARFINIMGDDEDVAYAVACLCPESIALSATPLLLTQDRFGRVPRVYSETLQDRRVQRELQKKMYTAQPRQKIFSLTAGHSPFFSVPEEFVAILTGSEVLRDCVERW